MSDLNHEKLESAGKDFINECMQFTAHALLNDDPEAYGDFLAAASKVKKALDRSRKMLTPKYTVDEDAVIENPVLKSGDFIPPVVSEHPVLRRDEQPAVSTESLMDAYKGAQKLAYQVPKSPEPQPVVKEHVPPTYLRGYACQQENGLLRLIIRGQKEDGKGGLFDIGAMEKARAGDWYPDYRLGALLKGKECRVAGDAHRDDVYDAAARALGYEHVKEVAERNSRDLGAYTKEIRGSSSDWTFMYISHGGECIGKMKTSAKYLSTDFGAVLRWVPQGKIVEKLGYGWSVRSSGGYDDVFAKVVKALQEGPEKGRTTCVDDKTGWGWEGREGAGDVIYKMDIRNGLNKLIGCFERANPGEVWMADWRVRNALKRDVVFPSGYTPDQVFAAALKLFVESGRFSYEGYKAPREAA